MSNYEQLVKALRSASTVSTAWEKLMHDAADAIEALNRLVDLNTERCEALRKQLREAHESYERHLNELEAQLPKRGEWEKEETGKGIFKQIIYKCSICGRYLDFDGVNAGRGDANYCPCCGAKMEVQE